MKLTLQVDCTGGARRRRRAAGDDAMTETTISAELNVVDAVSVIESSGGKNYNSFDHQGISVYIDETVSPYYSNDLSLLQSVQRVHDL